MYDEEHWKRYELSINHELRKRYDIDAEKATSIINMMCMGRSTRAAALERIESFLYYEKENS